MSAHTLPSDFLNAPWRVVDPGNAGTLNLTNNGSGLCAIKTTAAETRTVPAPQVAGQKLALFMDTDGGTCTVTVSTGQGVSTVVLDDAGDAVFLEAITVGGTVKWSVVANPGAFGGTVPVTLNMLLNTHCVDQAFFIADRPYIVKRIDEVHATAGNDAGAVNMQVVKDTGTDAPGAGTNLLTNNSNAGFDMKGTANTVQNGTLTATAASLQLAVGDRLSVDYAGTVTALAGAQLTVVLQPI